MKKALLIILFVLIPGCSEPGTSKTKYDDPISKATYKISFINGHGSGFIIKHKRRLYLVSAFHVMDSDNYKIYDLNNNVVYLKFRGDVIGDVGSDLWVREVVGYRGHALIIARSTPKYGDDVIAYGYGGHSSHIDRFSGSFVDRTSVPMMPNVDVIGTDLHITRGMSGGPLVDFNGHVIGVNVLTSNLYSLHVSYNGLLEYLNN